MFCVLVTTWTKLLNFQTIWIVTTVLLCNVVTFFAINACHGDLWTYVRALACHGLTPSIDCEVLRLPEPSRSAKFTLVELVAEAGFEPTTQRL